MIEKKFAFWFLWVNRTLLLHLRFWYPRESQFNCHILILSDWSNFNYDCVWLSQNIRRKLLQSICHGISTINRAPLRIRLGNVISTQPIYSSLGGAINRRIESSVLIHLHLKELTRKRKISLITYPFSLSIFCLSRVCFRVRLRAV